MYSQIQSNGSLTTHLQFGMILRIHLSVAFRAILASCINRSHMSRFNRRLNACRSTGRPDFSPCRKIFEKWGVHSLSRWCTKSGTSPLGFRCRELTNAIGAQQKKFFFVKNGISQPSYALA